MGQDMKLEVQMCVLSGKRERESVWLGWSVWVNDKAVIVEHSQTRHLLARNWGSR